MFPSFMTNQVRHFDIRSLPFMNDQLNKQHLYMNNVTLMLPRHQDIAATSMWPCVLLGIAVIIGKRIHMKTKSQICQIAYLDSKYRCFIGYKLDSSETGTVKMDRPCYQNAWWTFAKENPLWRTTSWKTLQWWSEEAMQGHPQSLP